MNSIVSYKDRGIGGKNTYRGNCSPKLLIDLHEQFGFNEVSDYMAGSYTTADAAKQIGIKANCYDLNHGFDVVSMDIPEKNEFIFWHPPYGDMITYAGEQYSAEEVKNKYGIDPIKADLSHIKDWDEFVRVLNFCMMKQYASLEKGGRIAVLMGDMKRKGKLFSMLADICKPGTLENIVIKAQHNCVSERTSYSGKFIPIVHEYLMICRKDTGLIIPVITSSHHEVDIRDLTSATWKDIVIEVMKDIGTNGICTLQEIYDACENHRKAQKNPHWKEKIRQTLQIYPQFFSHQGRGEWAVTA